MMFFFVGACDCLENSSTRTVIEEFQDLYHAVADIGNWRGLCGNLKVNDSVMDTLKHNGRRSDENKLDCLQAFFDSGTVTWEEVREAVAKSPLFKNRVADQITKKYIKKGELKDIQDDV